jgi:hypothetical protein
MTNYDAEKPSNTAGAGLADRSWKWLQERLPDSSAVLADWIDADLAQLENRFDSFITPRSLKRHQSQQFQDSRRHSSEQAAGDAGLAEDLFEAGE